MREETATEPNTHGARLSAAPTEANAAPLLHFALGYRQADAQGGTYTFPAGARTPEALEAFWDELLPGACSPRDQHDAVELWFIAAGRGRLVLDGAEHDLAPGAAVLIPSQAVHQVWCVGDEPLVTYSLAWA
ncbi:cupin domain-containing protein [Dactylosporangium sp. CA-139114]|uniref:cupin domain-containing protein n=1 Tax=Dactylosporangium sp. CA-139114 TaxID=3239931 RepID=UPI003D988E99